MDLSARGAVCLMVSTWVADGLDGLQNGTRHVGEAMRRNMAAADVADHARLSAVLCVPCSASHVLRLDAALRQRPSETYSLSLA